MALVITVTKGSVTIPQEGMYAVTFNLSCEDTGVEVISEDFTERKRPDVPWTTVGARMVGRMQARIDKYNASAQIFNSAQIDAAVIQIQGALVG